MATILLSAAGAALGGAVGGGALGLSSIVIGKAIGATVGKAIDQKLLGTGSGVVETGRVDRMRLMGAGEGSAVARIYGRMRVAGNVIWTSRFKESVSTSQSGGGKGAPKGPVTKSYSYSVSVALALCEGEIARIGRIWADGAQIAGRDLNMRVYKGSSDQLPDPLIAALDGDVPAYRGMAYVVIEDLEISQFGNRVPQFSFEVLRTATPETINDAPSLQEGVQAVAMIPGTGEYALATTPIYRPDGLSETAANINTAEQTPDIIGSLDALEGELPNCGAVSLVVSWFGDDLRAGECSVKPKVEFGEASTAQIGSAVVEYDDEPGIWGASASGSKYPWSVAGLSRTEAEVVAQVEGRPIYGGTPTDASVVEAIEAIHAQGKEVMFYPFVLMEILEGNALPDPWSDAGSQPPLPWRGRITTAKAPGVAGSTDKTAAARGEVERFMGAAQASDFAVEGKRVVYTGPEDWGYRRMILHYAALCHAAGGVGSFCIGSEMRSLTRIRDAAGNYPAVEGFKALAGEVRAILGPDVKLGYAADWSEYFGHQPSDGSGDVVFHLDPLWGDAEIDFIGIDNYMPISDWRDGEDHLDARAQSIYELDYLRSGIRGGEGYEWYYRDAEERRLQIRTPIADGAYGEDWIYRYKDLWNWWGEPHYNRNGGVRASDHTEWEPRSKPIWFTEIGCGAVDKGPNQPNKFMDEKSSESGLPHFSSGRRDDLVQMQYLRAYFSFFAEPENNPVSDIYDGPMVDMSKAFVWAWDARPWPDFPNNLAQWSDGTNYLTGHWLNGRSGVQHLALVVADLCEAAGVTSYDVSGLEGVVRGFAITEADTIRAALQPLMLAYGFDAIEIAGRLVFRNRQHAPALDVAGYEVVLEGDDPRIESVRLPEPETTGDVLLGYVEAEGDFEASVAQARFDDDISTDRAQTELPLALSRAEAATISERWLSEARVARDMVQLALPPSRHDVQAGDLIRLQDADHLETLYRVDRIEDRGARAIEAVRVERQIYVPSDAVESNISSRPFAVPVPVAAQFMDLPLLRGTEVPHAPHLAVSAQPWPGSIAAFDASEDAGYGLNTVIEVPSTMGVTLTALDAARAGQWSNGGVLRVKLAQGALSSASRSAVLGGANAAALGDGSSDLWEVFQFSQAELVAPDTYDLSVFLRGQAGSDGVMPEIWPEGSRFVLLDGAAEQIDLDLSARDLARHYRVGPALRPYDDPSYRHYVEAFKGIGLRPYRPAHLRALRQGDDLQVSWVRRTRIDGDNWNGVEVPLGEEAESYLIRVSAGGSVVREVITQTPEWTYSAALRQSDLGVSAFSLEAAQLSMSFGPGPFARIDIND
jgi:hypothetical protein